MDEANEKIYPPTDCTPIGADFPDLDRLPWQEYRKRTTTKMVRLEGPFRVITPEGLMICMDGWLARDCNGGLYPIADDVQRETYEKVE